MQSAAATAKPYMQAAQTGMQVANALTPPETPGTPPPQAAPPNAQTLTQIAQQSPQMNIEQEAEMRKKRRMGLLGAS
jgi:hypothetical protein